MDGNIRLHVGNGKIYLREFLNLDISSSGSALAKDSAASVERWATTEDAYYARQVSQTPHEILEYAPGQEPPPVCDCYGSWWNMPFDDGSVSEVLSRQVYEHLDKEHSRFALMEARRVLCVGGLLRLDVPDHDEAMRQYADACAVMATTQSEELRALAKHDRDFQMRHLLGSRKCEWAYHMGSWTREQMIRFVEDFGFELIGEEANIHPYPAFCLQFRKLAECVKYQWLDQPVRQWKAAWEYCGTPLGTPLTVPDDWRVLEVGPGTAPWPRADVTCDIVPRDLPNFTVADVENLPFGDKCMDFGFVSHCLEHVPDPAKAASELSRVAKAGCVVCPSPMKDGLFGVHEQDHKWHVVKGKDRLFFHRIEPGLYPALYDSDVSGALHRILRYGDRRLDGLHDKMRRWWSNVEPLMDVVFPWTETLRVEVCE